VGCGPSIALMFAKLNILINNGNALLCDFGLSMVPGDTGSIVFSASRLRGTLNWMSPELLLDDSPKSTAYSDVWAFGCGIKEVITGIRPFVDALNQQYLMVRVARGSLPCAESDLSASLDQELSATVWRLLVLCWQFEPDKRITVPELLTEFPLASSQPDPFCGSPAESATGSFSVIGAQFAQPPTPHDGQQLPMSHKFDDSVHLPQPFLERTVGDYGMPTIFVHDDTASIRKTAISRTTSSDFAPMKSDSMDLQHQRAAKRRR